MVKWTTSTPSAAIRQRWHRRQQHVGQVRSCIEAGRLQILEVDDHQVAEIEAATPFLSVLAVPCVDSVQGIRAAAALDTAAKLLGRRQHRLWSAGLSNAGR